MCVFMPHVQLAHQLQPSPKDSVLVQTVPCGLGAWSRTAVVEYLDRAYCRPARRACSTRHMPEQPAVSSRPRPLQLHSAGAVASSVETEESGSCSCLRVGPTNHLNRLQAPSSWMVAVVA